MAGELGLGVDVVPGGQDEGAQVGPGVGEGEDGVVGDHVGVGHDVDVDRAGAPALLADAVEGLLDGVAALQEAGGGSVVFTSATALKYEGCEPGSTPHGSVS